MWENAKAAHWAGQLACLLAVERVERSAAQWDDASAGKWADQKVVWKAAWMENR